MLSAGVLSFVVALVTLRVLMSPTFSGVALDRPNERSLHTVPVPRSGGIAILLGAAAGAAFQPTWELTPLFALAACLAALSFIDDRRGLPVAARLLAQLATAAGAVALVAHGQPAWLIVLAFFATVWMTNLYNFMDGADGMAGGMAVSGFGAYVLAATWHQDRALGSLSLCICAAALGFLSRNFPRASIFMGDVGSTALGFLAATLGLFGYCTDSWPLWFPLLVFLPFIADASITLTRRALRGERVWEAHREHYYQRLIRSGWGHRRMALTAYAIMVGTAGSATLALRFLDATQGWMVLGAWLGTFGALMIATDLHLGKATLLDLETKAG
ncbi:MAG: hypothetical protein JWN04_2436 [Myxococcaceae bacterium]|nr:hypothetical protein [Myxococcaceae bacterium]